MSGVYSWGGVLIDHRLIIVFTSRNKFFESLYLNGKISLELIPQGTLAGRLRAHAAGIPAFYTPTGAHTAVEKGEIPIRYQDGGMKAGVAIPGNKKEGREFKGRRYVLEPGIAGDVAFIRAWKADGVGNCVFRLAGTMLMRRGCAEISIPSDILRTISPQSWRRMQNSRSSRWVSRFLCMCAFDLKGD